MADIKIKTNVKLEGMDELLKTLKQIGKVSQTGVNKAASKAASFVVAEARKNAPRKSGTLKKSIKKRVEKGRVQGRKIYHVGFYGEGIRKISKSGKVAFYPVSQEYGWVTASGKKIQTKPFLRPAIDKNRTHLNKLMMKVMYDELGKVK